jgi:hypothetical protein
LPGGHAWTGPQCGTAESSLMRHRRCGVLHIRTCNRITSGLSGGVGGGGCLICRPLVLPVETARQEQRQGEGARARRGGGVGGRCGSWLGGHCRLHERNGDGGGRVCGRSGCGCGSGSFIRVRLRCRQPGLRLRLHSAGRLLLEAVPVGHRSDGGRLPHRAGAPTAVELDAKTRTIEPN